MKSEKGYRSIVKRILFPALISIIACACTSTHVNYVWPVAYYPTQWRAPVEKVMLISNTDSVTGYIKLIGQNYWPVIPDGSKWDAKSIINIKIKTIKYMKLEDSVNGLNVVTEYQRIDQNYLCELLARKDKIAVYDDFLRTGGWKHKMFLVTLKGKVQMFSWIDLQLHFGLFRPLLIKFIKKRYNTDPRIYQNKTKNDLIFYILDQENNKEAQDKKSESK